MAEVTADDRWSARAWGVAAAVATFGGQLLQVRWWSPRIPVGDEWQLLGLYGRAADSGVRPAMLWEQHNEHRIVIARVVFLTVRQLGGWVVLAPQVISALMMAATVGVLVSTLLRLGVRPVIVAVAASFAATPLQWENAVWGFQVQFTALVAGTVIPLCLLARRAGSRPAADPGAGPDRRSVAIAVAGGLWCTGTIASGLFTWGVLAGALAVAAGPAGGSTGGPAGRSGAGRRTLLAAGSVAVAGLVVLVVYRIGYVTPGRMGNGGLGNQARWSAQALLFPFAGLGSRSLVGSGLPFGVVVGSIIGALMIVVLVAGTVVCARRRDAGRAVMIGGLVVWVLPQIALIGAARAASGEIYSRYASLFVWIPVAAVVAADTLLTGRSRASGVAWRRVVPLGALLAAAVVQHVGVVRDVPRAAADFRARDTLDTTIAFLERGSTGDVAFPNPYANEQAFAVVLREAQAEGWMRELPDEVRSRLSWAPTTTGTAWSRGGAYPGSGVPSGEWASWSGSDDRTGVLLSQPFRLEPGGRGDVAVVVRGGPDRPGNRLELVDAGRPDRVLATFSGDAPGDGADRWWASAARWRGTTVRLRATDGATGYLGWFAVEPPMQPSRLGRAVDGLISWAPGLLLAGVGLAVAAGLTGPVDGAGRRSLRPE